MSDHIMKSSMRFKVTLSLLMSCMLSHGYYANELLCATVIPIPKNTRGNLTSSDNYRGISLCNSICKLFDIIFIDKCGSTLATSNLQFAFKANHSTDLCTGMLIETVNHFLENDSEVYGCLLDASKAFDKVHYGKLFEILISRNVPIDIVRFLLDVYVRQNICVK